MRPDDTLFIEDYNEEPHVELQRSADRQNLPSKNGDDSDFMSRSSNQDADESFHFSEPVSEKEWDF